MNYIELINRFWSEVEMKGYKSQEANLYFYLLHYCNRIGWVNPFSLPNKRAVLSTGLSEKTLIECRCRLSERGLIDFRSGKRKAAPPVYCFPVEGENGFYFPWESKTESKTGSKTESKNGSKTGSYNKTKNSKQKTDDVAVATLGAPQRIEPESLFADEGRKAAKKKAPPKPKTDFEPPSLEEVRRYFLSQDADKRLANWEESAQRFYDNFTAVDWRDKYNRRITRWDSRANSWILDDEKRQKEKTATNETNQTDRFSERRGTEPNATSRKGFKGTF